MLKALQHGRIPPVYRKFMKNTILSLMVACFGLAMAHTVDAAEKITHEQIEEVMKKGFKAKLHNDLEANKEVLALSLIHI